MGKRKNRSIKNISKKKVAMIVAAVIIVVALVFGIDEFILPKANNVANTIANSVNTNNTTGEQETKEGESTSENNAVADKNAVAQGESTIQKTNPENNLQVYFIDVGQSESILITNKNEAMIIDGGGNANGKQVVDFIKSKGVTTLKYVIATHPHEDHIGGLDNVIKAFGVENVYMPDMQTETKSFEDLIDAIQSRGLKIRSPEVGHKFKVGDSDCEVMSSIIDEENLNASSIVIRLQFGNESFLFMADAEAVNEQARQWPRTNVLKVGHHGSNSSSTQSFLDQVKPEYAIIMCGTDNDYGYPHKEPLERLQNVGTKIFRTDKNGTITITTDGKVLEVKTEK